MGKHLTVVDVGRGDCVSAYEPMSHIDADAVLVSVMAGTVLLHPASVKIPLAQAVWLVFPSLGQLAFLDGLILSSGISLPGDRYKRGIDNLSTAGFQPLGS